MRCDPGCAYVPVGLSNRIRAKQISWLTLSRRRSGRFDPAVDAYLGHVDTLRPQVSSQRLHKATFGKIFRSKRYRSGASLHARSRTGKQHDAATPRDHRRGAFLCHRKARRALTRIQLTYDPLNIVDISERTRRGVEEQNLRFAQAGSESSRRVADLLRVADIGLYLECCAAAHAEIICRRLQKIRSAGH